MQTLNLICIGIVLQLLLNNSLVSSQCHSACATCHGTLITECDSCNDTPTQYYLQGTECKTACTGAFYGNTATDTCDACNAACLTCHGSLITQCDSCSDTPTQYYLQGTECKTACTGAFYGNTTTDTCDACNAACLTCHGSLITECDSCSDTPTQYYLQGTECKTACTGAFYGNTTTDTCDACNAACLTCHGSLITNCDSCSDTPTQYYLQGTECKTACTGAFYGNTTTDTCDACNAACLTCHGSLITECDSCSDTPTQYYLQGTECKTACTGAFYGNTTSDTCDACNAACLTCHGSLITECDSCSDTPSQYYLQGTECKASCTGAFYGNTTTDTCDACNAACLTCHGSLITECDSCSDSPTQYFLQGTECKTACDSGNWGDTSDDTCKPCDASCVECNGSTSTNCTQCSGDYLDSGDSSCKDPCPAGQWGDSSDWTCKACDPSCGTCDGSATNCTSCGGSTYLDPAINQCVATCPTTPTYQFGDATDNTCKDCDANCASCTTTAVNCTSCTVTFLDSLDNTCKDPCPDGYWEDTSDQTCQPCDANCETCQGDAVTCTTCNPDYLNTITSVCQDPCDISYWGNPANNTCEPCDTACETCSTSATTCQTCNNGWYHIPPDTCSNTCPDGTGPVGPPTNACQACHSECTTCNGVLQNNCTTCTGTRYRDMLLNTCVLEANCGTYKYGDDSDLTDQKCLSCDANCYTCDGTATNCQSCSGDYLDTLTNTCVDPCPAGYLGATDPDWECKSCDPVCATCYGFTNEECLSCAPGYFFELGTDKCILCPKGTYGDVVTNFCELCHAFCSECYEKTENDCTECVDDYYLDPDLSNPNTCQINCIGTDPCTQLPTTIICEKVNPLNTCIACHSTCLTCNNIEFTGCATCLADPMDAIADRFLYLSQCILASECPSSYFADTTTATCSPCDNTCLTCQNFRYECTSCNPNYHLLNNVCRDNGCPDGYWADDTNWICDLCDPTCNTCNPPGGVNDCIDCPNNSYLLNGACITDCPIGMWEDDSDNTCKFCDTGCYECDGSSSNCSSCVNTYFLQSDGMTCDTFCPTFPTMEYEAGPPINECVVYTCDQATCDQCRSGSTNVCLVCDTGNYLDGNICTTDCGYGRWEDDSTLQCQNCDHSCQDCQNTSTECIGCTDGFYYYAAQLRCITNCYDGWFPVGPPTNECQQCHADCLTCDGGTNTDCLTCNDDHYIIGQQCYHLSTCPIYYFGNTDSDLCEPCVFPCLECTAAGNTGTFCVNCEPGYYLYQNDCLSSCDIGWVGNNLTWECEICHPTCMACDGVAYNQCTQCSYGSSVGPFLWNNECVYPCPDGTYQNVQESTCELCDVRCETCYNAGYENCYTCTVGYYYLLNSCIEDCGLNYYANENDICISCDPTCLDCNGSSRHDCTQCELSRIFENGTTCRACSEYYGMEDDPQIGENQQMVCREICGDGITVTDEYECDDGNNDDGDGCSSSCQVEPGFWKCVGGDANTAHTCFDERPIGFFIDYEPKKYYNYEENEKIKFNLSFNKTFELPEGRYIEDYLTFTFTGMDTTYNYEIVQSLRVLQESTSMLFKVTMDVTDTIKDRKLKALISNPEDFGDGFGQSLSYATVEGETIEQYIFYKDSERKTSQMYSYILFGFAIMIVLLGTFSIFKYKFYINQFFNVFLCIDLMQQIYFYRFINVRWSLCMIKFFENQRYYTNFFILNFLKTEIEDFSEYSTPFESFNIQEEVLLYFNNCGSFIQLITLVIVIFVIIQYLGQKNEQKLKCQPYFGDIYLGYLRFNLPLDFLLATGGVFFVFGIISLSAFQRAADFIVAVVMIVLTTAFYIMVAIKLIKNRNNLYKIDDTETSIETESVEAKIKRSGGTFIYRSAYIHTKYEDQYWKGLFTLVLIVRKIQLPFAIMIFQNYQNILITSQMLWHLTFCALLLKFKILKLFAQEFLTLVAVCQIYGLVGDEKEDEEYRLDYNWSMVVLFTLIIVINGIYMFSQIVLFPLYYYYTNANPINIQIHNVNKEQPSAILNYPELMKNQGQIPKAHKTQPQFLFSKNQKIEQRQHIQGQYLSKREMDNIYKKTGVRAKIETEDNPDFQGTNYQLSMASSKQIPLSDNEFVDSPHLSNEENQHLNDNNNKKHRKQVNMYNLNGERNNNKDVFANRVQANTFVQSTLQSVVGSKNNKKTNGNENMILKSGKANRYQTQQFNNQKFNLNNTQEDEEEDFEL